MPADPECVNCRRIQQFKSGQEPLFVKELETCYVVLGGFHAWRGYTLVVTKDCIAELHDMPPARRAKFLAEFSMVTEAVWNAFKPVKLNHDMLGNLVRHMHWHIFPRHRDDPEPTSPVWNRFAQASADPKYKPADAEIAAMKAALSAEIDRLSR